MAEAPGFEPRPWESKSHVLPLHHAPINSRLRLQVAQLFSPLWLCAGSNTFRLRYLAPESTIFPQCGSYWSAIWGSNSWRQLGRLTCYHYTNGTHARVFLPRIPRSPLNLGFQISYSVLRVTYHTFEYTWEKWRFDGELNSDPWRDKPLS